MSNVTCLMLSMGYWDSEDDKINEVNHFFEKDTVKGLVSLEDPSLPDGWYGGQKYFEAHVFIGAFNYLNLPKFVDYLQSMKWRQPEELQLIILEQNDVKFRLTDVFPSLPLTVRDD